ncbi:Mur ligase domain-containing protein, partial [Planktotalea sp.]
MNAAHTLSPPTKLPGDVGPIHFVGIGGIGMSGIAEVLLNHGYV